MDILQNIALVHYIYDIILIAVVEQQQANTSGVPIVGEKLQDSKDCQHTPENKGRLPHSAPFTKQASCKVDFFRFCTLHI